VWPPEGTMSLRLTDLRRVAADVARDEDPGFRVRSAMNAEGASDYSEVTLMLDRPQSNPSRVIVGVRRNESESQIRRVVRDQLRDHLQAAR
jgi:hypothetical protein